MAMFLSFIACLFTGFPVAWVLGGIGVLCAGVGYLRDMHLDTLTGLDFTTLGLVVNRIYKVMDNWVLRALPTFIFMGLMLDKSGVAERMMHAMQELFGRVRGGLTPLVGFAPFYLKGVCPPPYVSWTSTRAWYPSSCCSLSVWPWWPPSPPR
jgi:TRAP-type mannitol/chloroaromatic compound transport system permease large subunit